MGYNGNDYLDDYGYPTDAALDRIAEWDYNDIPGWFGFIESLWALLEWESETTDNVIGTRKVIRHTFSTGGWSGNEDLIRAMQRNTMMWSTTWVQSRRGGHYIFEDPNYGNI